MYTNENHPIRNDKLKPINKFILLGIISGANQYFWIPYLIFNFIVIAGQLTHLFQIWGNMEKIIGMTATFTIELQVSYKIIILYQKSNQLTAMHKNIECDFWDFDIAGNHLETKLCRRMEFITKVLWIHLSNGIFVATMCLLFPIEKYPPEIRQLPIQSWFPFDTNPSPLHEAVYIILSSNGLMCIITMGIFDFTFIYFAQHLLAQFDLLKYLLENLTEDVVNGEDDVAKCHSEEFQKEIYRRMSVCVEHHKKLLSFGGNLENCFSVGIAIQVLISLLTFVVIGFILCTGNGDLLHSLKLCIYFVGISVELAIFAIHGTELQYQSSSVAYSAYFCQWYLGKGYLRKGLVLLQMNAQKEIKLTAAGCVDLNSNTLLSVYRTAFSCVTLLQSMDQN